MIDFLSKHLLEIVFAVITALSVTGATTLCKRWYKEVKNYRVLLEEQETKKLTQTIEKELQPIEQEIEQFQNTEERIRQRLEELTHIFIKIFKYQFLNLCRMRMQQESLTQSEYDQLVELYKFYTQLGGNGQAKEYYEKTIDLPIKDK